jgi:phosphohistidine swiveling domain-containing protein
MIMVLPDTRALTPLADALDSARFGHKAAHLAALLRAGFDVPEGLVVPVGAEPSREDVAAALEALGSGPLVVRSSSVAEDLPDASFAGQYLSVLGVHGADAALEAIARVRASASSLRARSYADGQTAGMGVLVQRLVEGEASGVAFSANPVTGNRAEVVVTATRGLGEALVSGEVAGDEWTVGAQGARLVWETQGAIDADVAVAVAELARRVETHLGHPADIEWTVQRGRVVLLQARPITVLPTPPEIVAPEKGTWQKDCSHFTDPITPFGASTYLVYTPPAFDAMIHTWGLLPDRVEGRVIGHEAYMHAEPDDGGKAPPPWWLLAVVARLVPSLRAKLRRAREMVDGGMLDSVPASWEAEHKPRLEREIRRLADVDLAALDDDSLHAHLRTVEAFGTEAMTLHFYLTVPYMVGVHELVTVCEELLGMGLQEVTRLLQGLSVASTESTRELEEVAAQVRMRPSARAALGEPDAFERLGADPVVGDALTRWMQRWGLRTIGYDPGQPSFAERPSLVVGLLADLVEGSRASDVEARRAEAVATARRRLSGEALARFDRALAYAEVVYPQREDNVLYTDNLPAGLVRLVGLEMGRRLVGRGRLARATDMAMLSFDEMRSDADLRPLVAKRRSEIAWVRAHPGRTIFGPPPGAAPDLRGLPVAARRLNAALLWGLEEEMGPPKAVEGEGIQGLAASPGVVTARVRVIRSAAEIEQLRAGEVLVCPITTPAWTLVFPRAAALVTDGGSILSHAAIVAREHGIPAVVGTGDATRRLRDGQIVTVDGNRGVVRKSGG